MSLAVFPAGLAHANRLHDSGGRVLHVEFARLEELLAMLHKAKIAASVVMVPQGPTLRSLYDAEKVEDLVRRVADLSRKHGCSFVRAFSWLKEEMFADSIHPTVAGAEIFTHRIAQEVLLPALAKQKNKE